MKRKFFSSLLYALLIGGAVSSFTACKDYDDDIASLKSQVDKNNEILNQRIDAINELIKGGAVITSVTPFNNASGSGVVVTLSNGEQFTISNGIDGQDAAVWTIGDDGYWYKDGVKTEYRAVGKDGTNPWTIGDDGYWYNNGVKTEYKAVGTDGEDGVTWTIGEDGYWYKDGVKTEYKALGADGTNPWTIGDDGYWYKSGVKTEYKAVGQDGATWTIGADGYWYKNGVKTEYKAVGTDGRDGTDGKDGEDGFYYVPNETTGKFDLYKNGEFIKETDIYYMLPNTITAVVDGNYLILQGIVVGYDADGHPIHDSFKIRLNPIITGLTFVPEYYFPGFGAGVEVGKTTYNNWDDSDLPFVENKGVIAEWTETGISASYWLNSGTVQDADNFSFVVNSAKTRAESATTIKLDNDLLIKPVDGKINVRGIVGGAVPADDETIVFALQYVEDDVTVTSDYAALYVNNRDLTKLGLWWNFAPVTRGAIIVEEEWDGELPIEFTNVVEGKAFATIHAGETTKLSDLFTLKNGEIVINPADLGLEYAVSCYNAENGESVGISVDTNKLEITPSSTIADKDIVILILVKDTLNEKHPAVAAGYIKLHIAE